MSILHGSVIKYFDDSSKRRLPSVYGELLHKSSATINSKFPKNESIQTENVRWLYHTSKSIRAFCFLVLAAYRWIR